jgi:hypothetical protein
MKEGLGETGEASGCCCCRSLVDDLVVDYFCSKICSFFKISDCFNFGSEALEL